MCDVVEPGSALKSVTVFNDRSKEELRYTPDSQETRSILFSIILENGVKRELASIE